MTWRKEKEVDLAALAERLADVAVNARVRFVWLHEDRQILELFGRPARAALLACMDFSRPPNPERAALWDGLDGEVFDLHHEMQGYGYALMKAQADVGNWHDGVALDPARLPDDARRWRKALDLEAPELFLYHVHLFGAKATREEMRGGPPSHRAPSGDTPMTWFVRERIPLFAPETAGRPGDVWAAYQAALSRVGLNGRRIAERPCAGCERHVNSIDPHIAYCRHCRNRMGEDSLETDLSAEDNEDSCWKAADFRATLPTFASVAEAERELLRHRALWSLSCHWAPTLADSRAPDLPRRALDWFFYEGLCDAYDAEHFLGGVALTAAEALVREAGYAWRLEDGRLFLTHPRRPAPLDVASLLAEYGAYYSRPFESEEDTALFVELEYNGSNLWKRWKHAVTRLSHAAWPPLSDADVRDTLRRAVWRYDDDEDGVLNPLDAPDVAGRLAACIHEDSAWPDLSRVDGVRVDRARFGFEAWLPEKPGYHDEYCGRLLWRDDEGWVAALCGTSQSHEPDCPEPEAPITDDIPPIIAATRAGDILTLARLLDEDPNRINPPVSDFRMSDPTIDAPLYAAAESGQVEAVRLLLARGAETVAKPGHPCAALCRAAANGHAAVVEALLMAGVPPEHPLPPPKPAAPDTEDAEEEPPEDPETARVWADAQMAKILDEVEEEGLADAETPLLLAAKNSHADVVRLLLAHGADPDRRVHFSTSPALIAGWFHREVADALLEAGVAIDQRDAFGRTALHHAAIFAKMMDNLPEGAPESFVREAQRYRAGLNYLIEHGADINARDNKGETPLYSAATDGSADYVSWWLAHGADPTLAAHDGRTPLDAAESRNNREVYGLLSQAKHGDT